MDGHHYGQIQANDNSTLHLGNNYYYGDQERLKHVPGALFNAYGLNHRACHPKTRRELLEEIKRWAENPAGKSIFWLNGMAGTGKSTIAFTVAERLHQKTASHNATLGASFFFKRGEKDRASVALFFPTIVRQLRLKIPGLGVYIDEAVDTDPDICSKSIGEQFDKLLDGPLRRLNASPSLTTYIIVVDALDECQEEDDIRTLLQLCSLLGPKPHLCIRWFLTSRPELAIQLGFSRMSANAHQDVVLHEMPPPTIKHDILVFLSDAFSRIRDEYNVSPLSGIPLPEKWPSAPVLEELTRMAAPLFIVAATICRFIQDKDFDPQDQLRSILHYRDIGQVSELGQIYLPILDRVVSSSANVTTRDQIYQEFRLIVGAIVTVAEPLSRLGLAALLKVPPATIALRLRSLHSVLQIPQQVDGPVRPLHLSFGEFLSAKEIRGQPFYVDRAALHAILLTKCLDLLSQPEPVGLSENMCQLSYPGQLRTDLAPTDVQTRLSPAVQYACRYWTYHAQRAEVEICDNGQVHQFLEKHFLHWLESLSLLGWLCDAHEHIGTLKSLLATKGSTFLDLFLEDARRIILANQFICPRAPLQLYSSAIVFAPKYSIVKMLCGKVPHWIQQCPEAPHMWSSELLKMEGHTGTVNAVTFSPDGALLASASNDKTVRLWDTNTGQEIRKLEGHEGAVTAIAFSLDGLFFASVSSNRTVHLWNAKTGQEVQKIGGQIDWAHAIAFSPDGELLASAPDRKTVRLWYAKTGQELHKPEGQTIWVKAVCFSCNGSLLAFESADKTVRLWDTKMGQEVQKLEGYTGLVTAMAFSPDSLFFALASNNKTIYLWDTKTGHQVQKISGYAFWIRVLALSPNGLLVASASNDTIVRLWSMDMEKTQGLQKFDGHTSPVREVVFSSTDPLLVSVSDDETFRLWDTETGKSMEMLLRHPSFTGIAVFSPNGKLLALADDNKAVQLWDTKTGKEVYRLEGHTSDVYKVLFSPDGTLLASASSDKTIRLWDVKTGRGVQKLEGHTSFIGAAIFSHNITLLASGSDDKTVRVWDTKTGQEVQKLEGHLSHVFAIAFSHNSTLLASASNDGTVRLWDTKTWQELQRREVHKYFVTAIAFSPDGSLLALGSSSGRTIQLWDPKTFQQIGVLEDYPHISEINFSSDSKTLLTNRGSICINIVSSASGVNAFGTSNGLILKDDWIEFAGRKVLWLPPEYRRYVSAVHDNTLAIGCASGTVSFFKIQHW